MAHTHNDSHRYLYFLLLSLVAAREGWQVKYWTTNTQAFLRRESLVSSQQMFMHWCAPEVRHLADNTYIRNTYLLHIPFLT